MADRSVEHALRTLSRLRPEARERYMREFELMRSRLSDESRDGLRRFLLLPKAERHTVATLLSLTDDELDGFKLALTPDRGV